MVQRLLLSWSRKELGDSEPFGLLLMLDKVSVLASLREERKGHLLITTQHVTPQDYSSKHDNTIRMIWKQIMLCMMIMSSSWSWKIKQALYKDYGGNGGSRVG